MDIQKIIVETIAATPAVDAIAEKTGLKKSQVKSIIKIALPILMTAMAKNAASKEGAKSLADATKQHKSTKSVDKQIKEADTEDGAKIIKHILGAETAKVEKAVAAESKTDAADVAKVLATFAPAMLGSMAESPVEDKMKGIDMKDAIGALSAVDLSDGIDAKDVIGVLGKLF